MNSNSRDIAIWVFGMRDNPSLFYQLANEIGASVKTEYIGRGSDEALILCGVEGMGNQQVIDLAIEQGVKFGSVSAWEEFKEMYTKIYYSDSESEISSLKHAISNAYTALR